MRGLQCREEGNGGMEVGGPKGEEPGEGGNVGGIRENGGRDVLVWVKG